MTLKMKEYQKTGKGMLIKMDMQIFDGQPCARLAATKYKSLSCELFHRFEDKTFFVFMTFWTDETHILELGTDLKKAQGWYDRLPRRVDPSKIMNLGIVNPLKAQKRLTHKKAKFKFPKSKNSPRFVQKP